MGLGVTPSKEKLAVESPCSCGIALGNDGDTTGG